jgi:hypothetical protein
MIGFIGKLVKAGIDTALIPVAVVKDVLTLGGATNDGYFANGGHTYTGKRLKEIENDIEEAKDEL